MLSAAMLTFITVKLTVGLPSELAALEPLVYALILILAVMWNNAPFIRPLRVKLYNKLAALRDRLLPRKEVDGSDENATAAWDTIPTKIPMDALLSTDFTVDHTFEADRPEKEDKP
jgi:hypothetical protein